MIYMIASKLFVVKSLRSVLPARAYVRGRHLSLGYPKVAGWFNCKGKSESRTGWWLGVALWLRKAPLIKLWLEDLSFSVSRWGHDGNADKRHTVLDRWWRIHRMCSPPGSLPNSALFLVELESRDHHPNHLGVSINGGTPKWIVYNGKYH